MTLEDSMLHDECVSQEVLDAKNNCAKLPMPMIEKEDVYDILQTDIGAYALRNNGKAMVIGTPAGLIRISIDPESPSPKWTMTKNEKGEISLWPSLAVSTNDSKGNRVELFHGWVKDGQILNA